MYIYAQRMFLCDNDLITFFTIKPMKIKQPWKIRKEISTF